MERELEAPRQELRALRNEIAALERRLEQPHHAAVAPEPESEPNRLFSQENYEPGRELQTQLGHLESGLSFLSKLTGFRMTDYSMTRLELPASARKTQKNELRVLRKGHLAGSCYTVNFQLEFELLEVQVSWRGRVGVRAEGRPMGLCFLSVWTPWVLDPFLPRVPGDVETSHPVHWGW
uniref:Centromere protein P n=1 Tax=Monodelphis domestica TaxID=13616 RepID=A0A5F8HJB8_MONDO